MAHVALQGVAGTGGLGGELRGIVENGPTPEHLAAMKQVLATAMGQREYWARADRW